MKASHLAALENHVRSLKASPLFNLSLASKELFHSNFLAWLCEVYPSVMGPFFAKFTKSPCPSCDTLKVYREQRKFDLTIEFPNAETLIVENKVKSIASPEQLVEYSDKVKDKEHTAFLLLSLTRPSFVPSSAALIHVKKGDAKKDDKGTPWHFLSYSDLLAQLETAIGSISDRYHSELLKDYIVFVKSLVAIASHFSVDSDYEDGDFFLEKQEKDLLEEIRLHDLIDKIRFGQLAERIKTALESEGCKVVAKAQFYEATQGVFMLDSALYQGEALCEFKYLARAGALTVDLGVMLQGNAVKVYVEAWEPRSRQPGKERPSLKCQQIAKGIAEELMSPKVGGKIWFDLARITSTSKEMPASGFNNYFGTCFYRYKKADQSSPKGLVDLLVGYARSIRNTEDSIRSQIGIACDVPRDV